MEAFGGHVTVAAVSDEELGKEDALPRRAQPCRRQPPGAARFRPGNPVVAHRLTFLLPEI